MSFYSMPWRAKEERRMHLLQFHLPLPQVKTRYEWRPLRPGTTPRECEILTFGGQIRS